MYDAAKIFQNTIKLMQKYRKNHLEMTAPLLLKADFKFLNYVCRLKFSTFECNFLVGFIFKQGICLLFFCKSVFGLVVFFTQG